MGCFSEEKKSQSIDRITTKSAVKKLCSRRQFRAILKQERLLSDRSGHRFALVVYDLNNGSGTVSSRKRLIKDLVSRVRTTDDIGRYGKNRIAVILRYSSEEGASRFIHKVDRTLSSNGQLVNFQLYYYPPDQKSINQLNTESPDPGLADRKDDEIGYQHSLNRKSLRPDRGSVVNYYGRTGSSDEIFRNNLEDTQPLFVSKLPVWKRPVDIAIALASLIVFLPFLLIIPVAIKLSSPGPVFFRQRRVGYGCRSFELIKYRTMTNGVDTDVHEKYLTSLIGVSDDEMDSDTPMAKLSADSRVFPFGHLIRKCYLDELPQLFNVLKGEMSIVGPRPALPYEVAEYRYWCNERFDVLPGMTGLWQVSGKNELSFNEMVRLDIRYTKDQSLWLDMKILFRTPLAILTELIRSTKKQTQEGKQTC